MNRGPPTGIARTTSSLSLVAEVPFGRGRRLLADLSTGGRRDHRRLAGEHEHVHLQRPAVQRRRTAMRAPIATPAATTARTSSAIPTGRKPESSGSTPTPIGVVRQRLRASGARHLRDLPRNALRGPGYWRVDASLFKHFSFGATATLELRARGGRTCSTT